MLHARNKDQYACLGVLPHLAGTLQEHASSLQNQLLEHANTQDILQQQQYSLESVRALVGQQQHRRGPSRSRALAQPMREDHDELPGLDGLSRSPDY